MIIKGSMMDKNSFSIGVIGPEEAVDGPFSNLLLPVVTELFQNKVKFIALGLISEDGTAAGALAGIPEEVGVFRILSLYVSPAYRRAGGGTMLMDALGDVLSEAEPSMAVCTYTDNGEESRALQAFFEDRGAEERDSAGQYLIPVKDLVKPGSVKPGQGSSLFLPFEELSEEELRRTAHTAEPFGIKERLITERSGEVLPWLSFGGIKEGEAFAHLIASNVIEDKLLVIDSLYLKEGFEDTVAAMMKAFSDLCFRSYYPDASFLLPAENIHSRLGLKDLKRYLPGAYEIQHEAVMAF